MPNMAPYSAGYNQLSPAQKALAISFAANYRNPSGGTPYGAQKAGQLGVAYAKKMLPNEPAPQQQSAPSGGGGGGGGGGGPDYASQIQALNEQAAAYRKQAEDIIAQGEAKIKELEDADLQRQKAAELQNRLSIQAQASQARGQMGPSLKIAGAGQTPMTAGTQAFKRRRDRMTLAPIQSTAGINVPSGSVLNV